VRRVVKGKKRKIKKKPESKWSMTFSGNVTEINIDMPDKIIQTKIVRKK